MGDLQTPLPTQVTHISASYDDDLRPENKMATKTSLTQSQIKTYTAAFHWIDTDNKGTISRDELSAAFEKAMGKTFTKEEMDRFMQIMDKDNDQGISLEEYLDVMADCLALDDAVSSEEEELLKA